MESVCNGSTVMKQAEKTALAILRAGRSYDEAARVSGLSLEEAMRLWELNK